MDETTGLDLTRSTCMILLNAVECSQSSRMCGADLHPYFVGDDISVVLVNICGNKCLTNTWSVYSGFMNVGTRKLFGIPVTYDSKSTSNALMVQVKTPGSVAGEGVSGDTAGFTSAHTMMMNKSLLPRIVRYDWMLVSCSPSGTSCTTSSSSASINQMSSFVENLYMVDASGRNLEKTSMWNKYNLYSCMVKMLQPNHEEDEDEEDDEEIAKDAMWHGVLLWKITLNGVKGLFLFQCMY